jgi:hypothetical protein
MNVSTLEQWFTEYEDATLTARTEGERARDYYDGNQLTREEIATLAKRGQPPVRYNRIRRKIEWLKGLEVKQRTDPKAFPRTPKHVEGAESVTDAIRYVCDDQDWDEIRSDCYDNFLIEGFMGAEIIHEQNAKGEVDVKINHYPWDRLFYDPHSRKSDFSDARFKGVVLWMDEADFVQQFPNKADIAGIYTEATNSETHDDKPSRWADPKRKRIRVLLMWYRKGSDWHWSRFVRGEELDGGESPYKDSDGASICPLIMQSAFVGRDNERYGIVRDMFDPQDELNKRRSKSLHGINSRQTIGIKGAVDSVSSMKRELAKFDGHVELNSEAFEDAARVGMKPFDILPTNDQIAQQMQMAEDAKNEIDLLGANSALAGETGESASGRAVLARQQGGMIEIASLSDKLHRFTRETYRQIWLRIRQFWTEERWVRVTDEENNARFVGLNRPITVEEKLSQMDPQEAQMTAQQLGLFPGDPRLQTVVGIDNAVEELDVDILIEEVPDRVTLEGEIFEALMKYGPTLPPAVLIEADPVLPSKKKEKLLEMLQQVQQQPNPAQDLQNADVEAGIGVKQAQTMKLQAEAQMAGMPLARLA